MPDISTDNVSAGVDKLSETLYNLNHNPIRLRDESGMGVLILPHGGRVLGLHSSFSNSNFLWTNPALIDVSSARQFFMSDDWHNSGGDRTWLSPELNFFFPKYPDTSYYVPPPQLDAATYDATTIGNEVKLHAALSMRFYRGGGDLPLRIVKSVRLVADPLRNHLDRKSADLQFAGYRLQTSLQLGDRLPPESHLAIWNLLQLPAAGELLAPTYSKTIPTVFFGIVEPRDLRVEDRAIRYRMRALGEQKLCIPALTTTGRVGYWYPLGRKHVLVVRSFSVNPSGEYKDAWFTDPENDGFAIQACNIHNDNLGRFAELEYHAPAICLDTDNQSSEDVSFVWAYCGQLADIAITAKLLLGVNHLA